MLIDIIGLCFHTSSKYNGTLIDVMITETVISILLNYLESTVGFFNKKEVCYCLNYFIF